MRDRSSNARVVFRTTDGAVLELQTPRFGQTLVLRLEETGGAIVPSLVPFAESELRALFEGNPMDRARRVAALPRGKRTLVFGRAIDAKNRLAPHYSEGQRLAQIGNAIKDPIAIDALRNETIAHLLAAAKFPHDPQRQIRAAAEARIADRLRRGK